MDAAQQVNWGGTESGRSMIRNLYKETNAGVSRSFEKKRGLGKNHLGGKDRWEKRKMVGKGHTGCFRHVVNRSW